VTRALRRQGDCIQSQTDPCNPRIPECHLASTEQGTSQRWPLVPTPLRGPKTTRGHSCRHSLRRQILPPNAGRICRRPSQERGITDRRMPRAPRTLPSPRPPSWRTLPCSSCSRSPHIPARGRPCSGVTMSAPASSRSQMNDRRRSCGVNAAIFACTSRCRSSRSTA
jgi:hypothetical protein